MSTTDNRKIPPGLPSRLISDVELKFNGQTCVKFKNTKNGLEASLDHKNGKEEDCYICKLYEAHKKSDPSFFMYLHGQKHVYSKDADEWRGFYNGQQANAVSGEYLQICQLLYTSDKVRGCSNLIGQPP